MNLGQYSLLASASHDAVARSVFRSDARFGEQIEGRCGRTAIELW